MSLTILFDSMGAQVQIQEVTGNRLTTWVNSLTGLGYTVAYSDPNQPLDAQLDGIDVLVSTTRQLIVSTGIDLGYPPGDIAFLQTWISGGGNLLQFTNHSAFGWGGGAYWPLNEIQLASALGIPLVFAAFAPTSNSPVVPTGCAGSLQTLSMSPNPNAPSTIINGVSTVQAWDSGGIVNPGLNVQPGSQVSGGTVLIPLPAGGNCTDLSGLGYDSSQCAFAVLYNVGSGNVIVLGHSGIACNAGTCVPSPGQIGFADNLTFLNNCMAYFAAN